MPTKFHVPADSQQTIKRWKMCYILGQYARAGHQIYKVPIVCLATADQHPTNKHTITVKCSELRNSHTLRAIRQNAKNHISVTMSWKCHWRITHFLSGYWQSHWPASVLYTLSPCILTDILAACISEYVYSEINPMLVFKNLKGMTFNSTSMPTALSKALTIINSEQ